MSAYGFTRVRPTTEEVVAWRKSHKGQDPSVHRVRCDDCGDRIWGSGLGIGSHRRADDRKRRTCKHCGERIGFFIGFDGDESCYAHKPEIHRVDSLDLSRICDPSATVLTFAEPILARSREVEAFA